MIEKGLDAISHAIGVRTVGYRSPAWEITPYTLEALNACGFLYDSSCMGSDTPYIESSGGYSMLELPVQWILDDWPLFGFDSDNGGQIANPDKVFEIWTAEFEGLYQEGGYYLLTLHPEVSGRPHRIAHLERLIQHLRGYADVWWATAAQVAAHAGPQLR